MRSKLVFSAAVVASLFGATAIASAQTQPAPGASSSGNVGPGTPDSTMQQGTMSGGAMQNNNMGTTGSSMKRGPDASQEGAPTGASVGAKGDSTEPGKVKDGATR